jgi:hypothetical protein
MYLRERKDVVYENLRDLNFEYHAGKLSEADYESLKNNMEDQAANVLAEIAQLETRPVTPRKEREFENSAQRFCLLVLAWQSCFSRRSHRNGHQRHNQTSHPLEMTSF